MGGSSKALRLHIRFWLSAPADFLYAPDRYADQASNPRVKMLGLAHGDGYFGRIRDLAKAWETLNNENIPIESVEQYDINLFDKLSKLRESLDVAGYMDFSFAVHCAVEEVKKITDKTGTYIEKFKYLFVDEYQDINPIQEEFIKTLATHLDMLVVVGDDDQSIYGWRGANVQNIICF